jgi:predicted NBD/HSP70 family sugar kinase
MSGIAHIVGALVLGRVPGRRDARSKFGLPGSSSKTTAASPPWARLAIWARALPLISVQIGAGIGAGLIEESGNIYHRASGSAGDVGHIPSSGGEGVMCACGAHGCAAAVAAVPSMLRRLEMSSHIPESEAASGSDLLPQLLSERSPEAIQAVRESAELVGEVVATLCNIFNPRRVVITSALAAVSHELLAATCSVVQTPALPLATKDLVIDHSSLGDSVGIAEAYLIGRQHLLSPTIIKTLRISMASQQMRK